ncbi:Capsular polysaccharide biosynthesis/export periplasmic protein WcbA; Capsular polysaccharide export system protein KpsC [Olavius algarvensis associated proteobacterium Delta 3]|nr:Capsular polysaccharide biosynthesis/export periplasmic protein WcbA; Capsular polysaccharide export system protein KpsC [Olavius algarvensis associated proteobacterium Delta 3]
MKRFHNRHGLMTRIVCLVTLLTFIAQPVMAQTVYQDYQRYKNATQTSNKKSDSEVPPLGRGQQIKRNEVEKRFDKMSTYERIVLFNSLGEEEKYSLFSSLSENEKQLLFEKLSDDEKKQILSSMDTDSLRDWLEKFPELETLLEEEETEETLQKRTFRKAEPEGPSRIEKLFAGTLPEEISEPLEQFGYAGFEVDIISFTPLENVPVGDDYVIGPDDNFTIFLWGKVEQKYDVTVNRDGAIDLPRLGMVQVSGLTFAELKSLLSGKFKEYYPDFQISLTMGRIRSIQVFVVGQAKFPGSYQLSSLSTMVTAVFAAGGPRKNGSLRDIRLIRNGQMIESLDLYEFFLEGDMRKDKRLRTGDIIFFPVIGPVVGVAGNVKRPAIYEIREGEILQDAIDLAGGVLAIGHLQNVVVERIEEHQRRIVRSFNISVEKQTIKDFTTVLKDGDLVKIFPVHQVTEKVVYLKGHVKYPRSYEFRSNMRVSDLIPSYEALLPEPYLPKAEIVRLVPPDYHPELVQFDLGKMLEGDVTEDLRLQDRDQVIVFDRWEKKEMPEVFIRGEVKNPGKYRLFENMTVRDLIFQAGNFTERAFMEHASVSRIIPGNKRTENLVIPFSPEKAMRGETKDNVELSPDDSVYIRMIPLYRQALERKVTLEGEFRFPGEYSYSEGERLFDVIQRAGGLTEEAYPAGAVFLREEAREMQQRRINEYINKLEEEIFAQSSLQASAALEQKDVAIAQQELANQKELLNKLRTTRPTGRMIIDLEALMAIPTSQKNFRLMPGDRLTVGSRPDFVNVLGEVFNPNAIFVEKGKTVRHYIDFVGSTTRTADRGQMYLVKANGRVFSNAQSSFMGFAGWDSEEKRFSTGSFNKIPVAPGDTIIVPKRLDEGKALRKTVQITQILFQIAFAAGVLVAALK